MPISLARRGRGWLAGSVGLLLLAASAGEPSPAVVPAGVRGPATVLAERAGQDGYGARAVSAGAEPGDNAQCPPEWGLVQSPIGKRGLNYLTDVDAVSHADAWAVGATGLAGGSGATLAQHWDGTAWEIVQSPNVGHAENVLNGVAMAGPDDAWAVGDSADEGGSHRTLILHWDGTRWQVVPSPNLEGDNYLTAVEALSATNAWAVGYRVDPSERVETLALHYDGDAWSVFTTPNPSPSGNYLSGVAASSAGDVWAVGRAYDAVAGNVQTLTMHFEGAEWDVVPSPNQGVRTANLLLGVATVSPSLAWAVGFANGTEDLVPIILRWDGDAWSIEELEGTSGRLFSVAAVAPDDAWAMGQAADGTDLVVHWDGGSWSRAWSDTKWAVPAGTNDAERLLLGAAALDSGEVWSVGAVARLRVTSPQDLPLSLRVCPIGVGDSAFSRGSARIHPGASAIWTFPGTNDASHAVVDDSGLDLFDSGPRSPGSSFGFRYESAGSFRVVDEATGNAMVIAVTLVTSPRRGSPGTPFEIAWATEVPAGSAVDVQIRRPGSSLWVDWLTDQTGTSATFVPDVGPGTYRFRARTRAEAGAATLYSPPVAITVD